MGYLIEGRESALVCALRRIGSPLLAIPLARKSPDATPDRPTRSEEGQATWDPLHPAHRLCRIPQGRPLARVMEVIRDLRGFRALVLSTSTKSNQQYAPIRSRVAC
jgi:hypothetical protein